MYQCLTDDGCLHNKDLLSASLRTFSKFYRVRAYNQPVNPDELLFVTPAAFTGIK